MSNYLLEKLETLDRKIVKEEKDLTMMQKQIGKKMQKLSDMRKEREEASKAYKASSMVIQESSKESADFFNKY